MNLKNIATLGSTSIIQKYINDRLTTIFETHALKCKDFFDDSQILTIGNANGTLNSKPVKMSASFSYQCKLNGVYGSPSATLGTKKYAVPDTGILTITVETVPFGVITLNSAVTKNGKAVAINYTTNNMCGSLKLDDTLALLDLLDSTDIFGTVTFKVIDDGENDPSIEV